MNKRKTALFVEGKTEYIFVRDFLCAWYDYDAERMGIECYAFRADKKDSIPYPFGTRESENFYLIYNVGNDQSVISKMLKESSRLQNAGFQLIVGLNDMYCDAYHKCVKNRQIDLKVNERFKSERNEIIQQRGLDGIMKSHFAIMEVEAWFLGMYHYLQAIDNKLTPSFIMQSLGIDVKQDPEIAYYHPAKVLDDIYQLVGKQYDKHESDICAITSKFTKRDYLDLLNSGKCLSFVNFSNDIVFQ